MSKLRLAYYLIADSPELRGLRDASCRPFPEHITIRGRFLTHRANLADLVVMGREAFRVLAPFTAELLGPRVFADGLTWYELTADSAAYPPLRAVHRHLDRELVRRRLIDQDEVPVAHSGDSFTPHMTIAFRSPSLERLSMAPPSLQVNFVEWGLFRYDNWKDKPQLRCVFGEHLYARREPDALRGVPTFAT